VGNHCTGGVEHDGVANRALGARQNRARLRRVGVGVAAYQLVEVRAGEAESGRIKSQPVHRACLHSPDRARGGGGQLVEPVVAVYNQHAGAARGEHTRHHLGEVAERAANQPRPRPGRISQRPKQIEYRGHPELTAHRGCLPEGRMEKRREAEPDPDLGEAARDLLGSEVDAHSERFQHVRATGKRRRRPVAVFDHRHARGRNHNRGHGGHVDGVDAISPGADDVDGVLSVAARGGRGHLQRVTQHDVGQLADFGHGGNFHLHRHPEGSDLGRCRGACHDLVHRPGSLTRRQVPPTGQKAQNLPPRRRRHAGRSLIADVR